MTLETLQAKYKNGHPKNVKNHIWTEEERGIVRLHYDGTRESIKLIMGILNVSFYAVKGQVQFLGLGMHKQPDWTEAELEYIRGHYDSQSCIVIGRHLHRSINAVKIKATRMHLSLRTREGWYDKMDICEMLGVDHRKVQAWIDRGDLKASWHTGTKPSQKGMAMWHIEAEDLKEFIICHCHELQGRNIDIFSILDLCGLIPTDHN